MPLFFQLSAQIFKQFWILEGYLKMVKFDLLFILATFSIPFLCKAAEMSLYMTFCATIVSCIVFNISKLYVQVNEFKLK